MSGDVIEEHVDVHGRKIAIVALLGLVGLVVGVRVTSLGGLRYEAFEQLTLPTHSHEAPDLVAMTRGQHPGVRVLAAGGRVVLVSASGNLMGSANAVGAATRELIGHAHSKVTTIGSAGHAMMRPLGNPAHYGAVGLLAGLGAGIGLVVPFRRRVTTMLPDFRAAAASFSSPTSAPKHEPIQQHNCGRSCLSVEAR